MDLPSFSKGFESAITIGGTELHREDIAQLAIKVSRFRLGPLQDTDHDVTQRRESFGDNPWPSLRPQPKGGCRMA